MICLYTREEHEQEQFVNNEEGGFVYCAECGEILRITDQKKHDRWFNIIKKGELKYVSRT